MKQLLHLTILILTLGFINACTGDAVDVQYVNAVTMAGGPEGVVTVDVTNHQRVTKFDLRNMDVKDIARIQLICPNGREMGLIAWQEEQAEYFGDNWRISNRFALAADPAVFDLTAEQLANLETNQMTQALRNAEEDPVPPMIYCCEDGVYRYVDNP